MKILSVVLCAFSSVVLCEINYTEVHREDTELHGENVNRHF